jgi:hypothetical protein
MCGLFYLGDDRVDGVLFEALERLKPIVSRNSPSTSKRLDAMLSRIFGHLGVEAFARFDQRRQQMDRPFFACIPSRWS